MQIQESVNGGRADDMYRAPIPVASIYGSGVGVSAILLGPLGAWQVPARYGAPPVTCVPSHYWPEAVRSAVVDALAAALARDVGTPSGAPGPEERSA